MIIDGRKILDPMKNMRLWHYTTENVLEKIFHDGEIKCSEVYLPGEITGVWLSTNTNWEETVRKAIRNVTSGQQSAAFSRDELFKAGFIPIRIEINHRTVKIADWKAHCKKISKYVAQTLELRAKEWSANPEEWYVSYKPISVRRILFPIEKWDGKRWIVAITKRKA
jgi:hypothetical protein